jgi:hypothetical protein
VPLSQPYLHEYGDDWITSSPRRLVDKALNGLMDKPGQQIIVMSQVLVDDINTSYQQFQNLQVGVGFWDALAGLLPLLLLYWIRALPDRPFRSHTRLIGHCWDAEECDKCVLLGLGCSVNVGGRQRHVLPAVNSSNSTCRQVCSTNHTACISDTLEWPPRTSGAPPHVKQVMPACLVVAAVLHRCCG